MKNLPKLTVDIVIHAFNNKWLSVGTETALLNRHFFKEWSKTNRRGGFRAYLMFLEERSDLNSFYHDFSLLPDEKHTESIFRIAR